MKRTIVALALVALATLTSAAACPALDLDDVPGEDVAVSQPDSLEEALAACGPQCKALTFQVEIYDVDMQIVPLEEEFLAELVLDAWAESDDGPQRVQVYDVNKSNLVDAPYTYEYPLPLEDIQIAGPNIVQISYQATVFLPAGWTLMCVGKEGDVIFSADRRTNTEGIASDGDTIAGLPVDVTVFCSWPGITDIT